MMDGEEKRENKISFVERINREAGRPTEDPKKHSKKEVWVLEDVTGNEYVSDRSSSAGERGSNASWMKRGKNLFEEMFYEAHPIKQQNQTHLEKKGSDLNLVREKSGGSTYSNADSTAAFVKEDYLESDNMKVRLPELVRQFSAEVLGTFLLVLFGDGAIAQVVLGNTNGQAFFGNFQSIVFGYGFALMIGILVSGNVSGGHLNPAVTLAMAVLRKCSWIQVPIYMLAQYLGAFLAAAVLYGIYADGINAMGGKVDGTAGIFASYPHGTGWEPSSVTLAFDQILGTALLLIIILAVTDAKNMNVSSGLVPLLIGLGLAAIHNSFGLNAGSAINP